MALLSSPPLAPPVVRLLGSMAGMVTVAELPLVAPPWVVAPPEAWGALVLAAPLVMAPPAVPWPGRVLPGLRVSGVVVVVVAGVVVVPGRLMLRVIVEVAFRERAARSGSAMPELGSPPPGDAPGLFAWTGRRLRTLTTMSPNWSAS